MKQNSIVLIIAVFVANLVFFSCESDNESFPNKPILEETILTAKNLIETTKEGTNEGDYAPGSQDRLNTQVNWANFILTTSGTDTAYFNANTKLLSEINIYKENIVKSGYPVYGEGSFFDLGKLTDYNIKNQFTIELKARFSELRSALGNILAAEDGGGIIIRYQNKILAGYINDGDWLGGNTREILEPNKWYHIAFVFDGTKVSLYVDGNLELSQSRPGPTTVKAAENVHVYAGKNPSYNDRFMKGNIIQVSIWNFPKKQEQIRQNLEPNYSGSEAGMLAYWPFNMNLGSTILDKSGKVTAYGTQITWTNKD